MKAATFHDGPGLDYGLRLIRAFSKGQLSTGVSDWLARIGYDICVQAFAELHRIPWEPSPQHGGKA